MATTPEGDDFHVEFTSPRDSAFGSPGWNTPSTRSVDPEDLGYYMLHGRQYGRNGPFPNDETAKDNHDLYNELFRMVLGTHYCAPVGLDGSMILDIFTRTGIWPIIVGEDIPSCQIIGIDEGQMPSNWVPPNVNFEMCDIEDGRDWTWKHSFRLIFARHLGGVTKDLPTFIRRCYDFLEPGGWLEIQLLTLNYKAQDSLTSWRSIRPGTTGPGLIGAWNYVPSTNTTSGLPSRNCVLPCHGSQTSSTQSKLL